MVIDPGSHPGFGNMGLNMRIYEILGIKICYIEDNQYSSIY